jgi:hypothetical protein
MLTGNNSYTGSNVIQAGTLELGENSYATALSNTDVQGGRIIFDYSGISPAAAINGTLALNKSNNFSMGSIRSTTANATFSPGVYDDGVSKVTVAYTYYGDANDDGFVNALDFNSLATNYAASGPNVYWYSGDFNYDGTVNSLDFDVLAQNFNITPLFPPAPSTSLGTLVPEPAGVAALGLLTLTTRRRRHLRRCY